MEKNTDGYYRLVCIGGKSLADIAEYYLQVANGKILDCVCMDTEYWKGISTEKQEDDAVGENVKNFFAEKFKETEANPYRVWQAIQITQKEFTNGKANILAELGVTKEEHDQRVADVFQAKKNKNTLDKNVINKLTDMKNGRSGK